MFERIDDSPFARASNAWGARVAAGGRRYHVLGHVVLDRSPIGFLSRDDRDALVGPSWSGALPRALPLAEVGAHLP